MFRAPQMQTAVEKQGSVQLEGLRRTRALESQQVSEKHWQQLPSSPWRREPIAVQRRPAIICVNVIKFNGYFTVSILYFPCSIQCCWTHPCSHETPLLWLPRSSGLLHLYFLVLFAKAPIAPHLWVTFSCHCSVISYRPFAFLPLFSSLAIFFLLLW